MHEASDPDPLPLFIQHSHRSFIQPRIPVMHCLCAEECISIGIVIVPARHTCLFGRWVLGTFGAGFGCMQPRQPRSQTLSIHYTRRVRDFGGTPGLMAQAPGSGAWGGIPPTIGTSPSSVPPPPWNQNAPNHTRRRTDHAMLVHPHPDDMLHSQRVSRAWRCSTSCVVVSHHTAWRRRHVECRRHPQRNA